MLLADLLLILPGRHAIVFFELFGKVGIIAEAHRVGDHGNGQILPLQQLSGKANAVPGAIMLSEIIWMKLRMRFS